MSERERKRVCVWQAVCTHRCPGTRHRNVVRRVCVHVDPGRLRVLVCPQTHCEKYDARVCFWRRCPHASMCECAREQVEMRHTGTSTGDTQASAAGPALDTVTTHPAGRSRAGPSGGITRRIPSLAQGRLSPQQEKAKHCRSKESIIPTRTQQPLCSGRACSSAWPQGLLGRAACHPPPHPSQPHLPGPAAAHHTRGLAPSLLLRVLPGILGDQQRPQAEGLDKGGVSGPG